MPAVRSRPDASWVGRVVDTIAPRWSLKRERARIALQQLRHYEAAANSYRTQGWRRSIADANAAIGRDASRLRDTARDLVRNNPYAESALDTICDNTIGWGILAKPATPHPRAADVWKAWADTTLCDADGLHDFAGLQKLALRTVVESGEVLVRRRLRLPTDGLPIPLQLQVLEPDYLDTTKDAELPNGGRIIQGIEVNAIGQRVAYWLFPEHPGSTVRTASLASVRVPAENVLHVFRAGRPGQMRGASWFASVLLRFKDLDEFEDATLVKAKIAACLAVLYTDMENPSGSLGANDPKNPEHDMLSPGVIKNLPPGAEVQVVQPPTTRDYPDYVATMLRSIATGLHITYEDLTGDYTDLPFSASRMSRLRHQAHVEDWRWRLMIPRFCDPVWQWAMQAAAIGQNGQPGLVDPPKARWTPPPPPMLDPEKEGLAYMRLLRIGAVTWPEMIRQLGYDPEEVLQEWAEWNAKLDEKGIVHDGDPRRISQAGQAQPTNDEPSTPPRRRPTVEDDDESGARVLTGVGLRRR